MALRKHLFVLLACLFVVSIGFGITLPVLPFYTERLALSGGSSRQAVALHVSLLTGVFALMEFLFAPLWGRLSDRMGRRPLVLCGIAGYAVAQLLFGLANSLWLLYGARILGGILASATLPAASAFVADATGESERGRGMAWLGTAVSLGAFAGPTLGGLASRRDWHFYGRTGHLVFNSFSVPFFLAAALTLLTLLVAARWLPESMAFPSAALSPDTAPADGRELARQLRLLLGLSLLGQFGLALFETTFVLFVRPLGFGPVQAGNAFMVCGLVMAVFQPLVVGSLAKRIGETMGTEGHYFPSKTGILMSLAKAEGELRIRYIPSAVERPTDSKASRYLGADPPLKP